MKWYQEFDITEVIALLVLAWIASLSAWKGDFGIANTVVGVIGGYMTKAIKNGAGSRYPAPLNTKEKEIKPETPSPLQE